MKPPGAVRLIVRTVDLGECIRRCAEHHRHLPVVVGGRVGFEVSRLDRPSLQPVLFGADPGEPCAWGIVGRPVARVLDAAGWVEYTRGIVPPDAPPGCASALLGAAARWARADSKRGTPIVTYTLQSEPGTSLRAAGWIEVARPGDRDGPTQWSCESRPRQLREGVVAERKRRWVPPWALPAAIARGWSAVPR